MLSLSFETGRVSASVKLLWMPLPPPVDQAEPPQIQADRPRRCRQILFSPVSVYPRETPSGRPLLHAYIGPHSTARPVAASLDVRHGPHPLFMKLCSLALCYQKFSCNLNTSCLCIFLSGCIFLLLQTLFNSIITQYIVHTTMHIFWATWKCNLGGTRIGSTGRPRFFLTVRIDCTIRPS